MKKQTSFFVTVIVILIVVIGFLGFQIISNQKTINELQNQNSNFQNRNEELENTVSQSSNKAKIVEFSISGMKKYNYTNTIFYSTVNVKVRNLGINNIEGLNLTIVAFGSKNCAKTVQVDRLQVDEEKEITTNVNWTYDSYATSTATLKLGNKTLDEDYVLFSEVY